MASLKYKDPITGEWTNLNLNGSSSIIIDSTLSQSGQAADAKAVGDAIASINIPEYTETDPTVPDWAKQSTKPNYNKSEVGLGNVDNVKQYSVNNPPVVYQDKAPSDTSVIWVDIDDDSDDGFQEAVNYALAQAKASGEFNGAPGEKGEQGLVWKGEYDGRYADRDGYLVNDVVYYNGSAYVCVKDADANSFPGRFDNWELLVSKGETGATGENGKTPVKGTDYFTAADKTEMVNAVIAALPIYNGEVS